MIITLHRRQPLISRDSLTVKSKTQKCVNKEIATCERNILDTLKTRQVSSVFFYVDRYMTELLVQLKLYSYKALPT